MATLDSNQNVHPSSEAQLDESRITEHESKSNHDQVAKAPKIDQQEGAVDSSRTVGNGDVSEEVPPHHTIHTDSELLPQPQRNSSVPEEADDPSTESYEDARATQAESHFDAKKPDETEAFPATNGAVYDRSSFGNIGRDEGKSAHSEVPVSTGSDKTGGDAAVDTNVTDRGYGATQEAVEPAVETEQPAKKEGFIAKMMEKLPGHHHKGPDSPTSVEVAAAHDGGSGPLEHDSSTDSPKKGIIEKIKEKLPGHHASHTEATPV